MNKLAILILSAAFIAPAWGQKSQDHAAHHPDAFADGEVRKVDKDAKKITLRHGPLPNLDMPAMTMVFQVADATMLDQVKVGDKVKFQAEKIAGGYRVTKIAPAN